jgi:excisionase family DNA binding protein
MVRAKTARKLPQYLSIAEVSEATTLSRATILRLIDSGALPATKVSRKLLIREDDVIALLDNAVARK